MQENENKLRIAELYETIQYRIKKRIQVHKHIIITLIVAIVFAILFFYMGGFYTMLVGEDSIVPMLFLGTFLMLQLGIPLFQVISIVRMRLFLQEIGILNTIYLQNLVTVDSINNILSQVEQIHTSMDRLGILKAPKDNNTQASHIHKFMNVWEVILSQHENAPNGGITNNRSIDMGKIESIDQVALPDFTKIELEYLYLILTDLRSDLASRLAEQRSTLESAKTEVERNITGTPELLAVSEAQKLRLDRQIEQFEELQRVLVKV